MDEAEREELQRRRRRRLRRHQGADAIEAACCRSVRRLKAMP